MNTPAVPTSFWNYYPPAPQIAPANPGWRVVLTGPDGDYEACPVAAWLVGMNKDGSTSLTPLARCHGQDGYVSIEVPHHDRLVGILAPGEEFDAAWHEAADYGLKAVREAEERANGA